jgi:hypothetical protein
MVERSDILNKYQQWVAQSWEDGRLSLGEISALKVYCEIFGLSVKEHEGIVDKVGVNRRELIDADNRPFATWLETRRIPLVAGSGCLKYTPVQETPPWRRKLFTAPLSWQNLLGIFSIFLLLFSVIGIIMIGF